MSTHTHTTQQPQPCALEVDWEAEDWTYGEAHGLTLMPVTYAQVDGHTVPVVTYDQFAAFINAWRANDPNGSWGEVYRGTAPDGALYLVHVSTDGEYHDAMPDSDDPDASPMVIATGEETCYVWPVEVAMEYDVEAWPAGEGETFALTGWDWTIKGEEN